MLVATNPFKSMYNDVIQSYSDYTVFHWSVWDAMNMINVMQVMISISTSVLDVIMAFDLFSR